MELPKLSAMQTVIKEKAPEFKFEYQDNLFDSTTEFYIKGCDVERSIEDRDVIFKISDISRFLSRSATLDHIYLKGESAIELGIALIKCGNYSLQANIINQFAINQFNKYIQYVNENRIKKTILTLIDKNPVNYSEGFNTYLLTVEWRENMSPLYDEDFSFEKVIYWSPINEEFEKQKNIYFNLEIIGYNRKNC